MRTESTIEPAPVEVRKLGVVDGKPCVYLYLNDDVKHETRTDMDDSETEIYVYDSTQITIQIPAPLLPEIDISLIARHDTNQTKEKQKTRNHLDDIKQVINKTAKQHVKYVDRLDRLTDVTDTELTKIREYGELDIKQL